MAHQLIECPNCHGRIELLGPLTHAIACPYCSFVLQNASPLQPQVLQAAPVGQIASSGQGFPTGQSLPFGQSAPVGQSFPFGQGSPANQSMPFGQGAPARQDIPVNPSMPFAQVGAPVTQGFSFGQGAPMGQSMPRAQGQDGSMPQGAPLMQNVFHAAGSTMTQNFITMQTDVAVDLDGRAQISGIEGPDDMIQRIFAYLKTNNVSRASDTIREFVDRYPGDFRGWQMMFIIYYDESLESEEYRDKVESYLQNMVQFARTPHDWAYLSKLKKTFTNGRAVSFAALQSLNGQANALEPVVKALHEGKDRAENDEASANIALSKWERKADKCIRAARFGGALIAILLAASLWNVNMVWALGAAVVSFILISVALSLVLGKRKSILQSKCAAAERKTSEARQAYYEAHDELRNLRYNTDLLVSLIQYLERLLAYLQGVS